MCSSTARDPVRRCRRIWVPAGLCLLALLFAGCGSGGDHSGTGSPVAGFPALFQFGAAGAGLASTRSPSGRDFLVQGPDAPAIHDGMLVRSDRTDFGGNGDTIVLMPFSHDPTVVVADFVFTAGSTDNQNIVLGVCRESLAKGSVQFSISPTAWQLFTVIDTPQATVGGAVHVFTTIAQGSISPALQIDGTTRYQAVLRFDRSSATATVDWGTGSAGPYSDSSPTVGLAANWGTRAVVQIRHPEATDGDVGIVSFGAE